MNKNEVQTYTVSIFMAGDIESAKTWLRKRCYQAGLCVTVTPTVFIYTGGEETGFVVGLVNYPRFPSTPDELWHQAKELAHSLVVECCQKTALVLAQDRTEWIQITPPGGRQ